MESNTAVVTRDGLIFHGGRVVADYRFWGTAMPAMVQDTVAKLRRAGVEVVDLRTPEQRRDAFAVLEREAAAHRARRAVEAGLDIETAGDLIDGARTVA
jgi:hypothetical protein